MLFPQNNRRIPRGVLRANKANPISRGLIGAWVPGTALIDVSGSAVSGNNLKYFGTSTGYANSREGPGVAHTGAGSGLVTPPLVSGSPFLYTNAITLYYRGNQISAPPNFANFIGSTYDNAGNSPYYLAGIRVDTNPFYNVFWNNAGSFVQGTPGNVSPVTSGMFSVAASFVVNGNVNFYLNGVNKGNQGFGAGAPTTTATSYLSIGEDNDNQTTRFTNSTTLVAYAWNRALSDAEIAALDNAPYSLLTPIPILIPPLGTATAAAPGVVFRRTLSALGTRVGSRQMVK